LLHLRLWEEADTKATGGGKRSLSEEEFFNEIADEPTKRTFRQLLTFADEIGAVRGWRKSSVSIQFPDPRGSKQNVTLFVMGTAGDVYFGWTTQQLDAISLPTQLGIDYVKCVAALFKATVDKKHPDSLTGYLQAAEVGEKITQFMVAVRDFVAEIKSASSA
jgi:hypothetical protein